ncbi:MAG TPA: MFS transporter [Kofleriaceae bacterium]|jgi:AAA family ATP:ADP antiporter
MSRTRVQLARDEVAIAISAAVTFGALLASYSALRPIRDALVTGGDPEHIPWLFSATFAAMLVLAPMWARLVAKGPRRVVPLAFHAFALCALGFALAYRAELAPVAVGRVFYVWSAVFNLFVVSVFWSLLADLVGPQLARRAYGPIAAGGTVGGILGPLATKAFVGSIGVTGVLAISAALLELAAIGVVAVRRAGRGVERPVEADPPMPGGAFDGLLHVVRTPQLRALVAYVLCTATAATFVYLAKAHIGHDLVPDRTARTELFASIDLWSNIAVLVVQLALAGPLLGALGPGVVLCVLPIVQGLGIAALAFAPSTMVLAIVLVVGGAATHGLTRPARELLFTVMRRDDKYRAKNAIDTVGYRFGDVGSVWLGEILGATGAAFAALPLAAIWLALATRLGAGFRRTQEAGS